MHSLSGSVINRNVSVSEKVGLKQSNVYRIKRINIGPNNSLTPIIVHARVNFKWYLNPATKYTCSDNIFSVSSVNVGNLLADQLKLIVAYYLR